MVTIASWNVNSLRARLPQLITWLEREQPDIVGLQELKLSEHESPEEELRASGYYCVCMGQKSYNGVAILAKESPKDVVKGIPGFDDNQARVIAATVCGIRFVCIYAPNGQSLDSDKFHYKLSWYHHLKEYLTQLLLEFPNIVVVGDFNVAPQDRDIYNPQEWQGHILASPKERAAFFELISLGFVDTFRLFEQPPQSFSWWDYRALGFERNHGLRIDHILANTALALSCGKSWIDTSLRKNERPSDHTAVLSTFYL